MATDNVFSDLGCGLSPMVSLPLVKSVGSSSVYAACAVIPLLVGRLLVVDIYSQTGTLNPRTASLSDD